MENAHSKLVNDTLISQQDENTRLWKNATGLAVDYDSAKSLIYYLGKRAGMSDREIDINFYKLRKIKFGAVGAPDIIGIRKIHITSEMVGFDIGLWVGYECKTGKAVQSKQQKLFEKMITAFGGLYKVIKK